MKERAKRALTITGLWSFASTLLFMLNESSCVIERILVILGFFTPVQFVITLVFSWFFLVGTYKKGKIMLVLDRFSNLIVNKKTKIHYCEECEDMNGKKTRAEWKAYYDKWWVKEYPKMKYSYYCDSCLIDNLEGYHTGGGPTISSYKKLVRLFNPVNSEIQASKKQKNDE